VPFKSNAGLSEHASARPNKRWFLVGLGTAAIVVTLIVVGALSQGGEDPTPQPQTDSVSDGLTDAQARWDSSDYMQQQATCASWRSYSHEEFFGLNAVPIEGRQMMTTLLDRNC
jgi:hypothetical protein